jgi:hypothetical protein
MMRRRRRRKETSSVMKIDSAGEKRIRVDGATQEAGGGEVASEELPILPN